MKKPIWMLLCLGLAGCLPTQHTVPQENICAIFRLHPHWRHDMIRSEKRWGIPGTVQMAVMAQESSFQRYTRPEHTYFLGLPIKRVSSAVGYAQALQGTWHDYQGSTQRFHSSRLHFGDAIDFIGWYLHNAQQALNLKETDQLYIAYHEGINGYKRQTWSQKPILLKAARLIKERSERYDQQLQLC
jgi:hypothetical protein